MSRKEIQLVPPKQKSSSDQLGKPLKALRRLLQNHKHIDKSSCQDMIEIIDNFAQCENKEFPEKNLLTTVCQAIEVLAVVSEEGSSSIEPQDADKDLFLIGKLLERTYIESVEIEQAQFFVKEIAIRVENTLAQRGSKLKEHLLAHASEADMFFDEIKKKCEKYFKENIREIEEKPQGVSRDQSPDSDGTNIKIEALKDQHKLLVKTLQNFLDHSSPQEIPRCLEEKTRRILMRLKEKFNSSQKLLIEQIKSAQTCLQEEMNFLQQRLRDLKSENVKIRGTEKESFELQEQLISKQLTCGELIKSVEDLKEKNELSKQKLSNSENEVTKLREHIEQQRSLIDISTQEKTENENLKQIIRADSKNFKEMLAKYEIKCVEVNELSSFKEKYNNAKEENAKLASAQTRLEKDYLLFHCELKKLKEKVKNLLLQNDELLSENVIYEAKVDTLEDKLMALKVKKKRCNSIREKDSRKESLKFSKYIQDQNRPQSPVQQSSFYATIRKKDDIDHFSDLQKDLSKIRDDVLPYPNVKILTLSEE